MDDKYLRKMFIETLTKLVKKFKQPSHYGMDKLYYERIYYMTHDIKYMCKGTSIPFMVHQTDFTNKLVELMA